MTALKKNESYPIDGSLTPKDELYWLFKENAEAIGANVYRTPNLLLAKSQLWRIIRTLNATKIIAAKSTVIDRLAMETFSEHGVTVTFNNNLDEAAAAEVGISEIDYAICETGSLCQDATDVSKRLVSSLPPVHIALVKEANIFKNFSDSVKLLKQSVAQGGSGYYTYISGPSRTSDIERVLTIGVHGPEALHIIIVADTN